MTSNLAAADLAHVCKSLAPLVRENPYQKVIFKPGKVVFHTTGLYVDISNASTEKMPKFCLMAESFLLLTDWLSELSRVVTFKVTSSMVEITAGRHSITLPRATETSEDYELDDIVLKPVLVNKYFATTFVADLHHSIRVASAIPSKASSLVNCKITPDSMCFNVRSGSVSVSTDVPIEPVGAMKDVWLNTFAFAPLKALFSGSLSSIVTDVELSFNDHVRLEMSPLLLKMSSTYSEVNVVLSSVFN